MAYGRRDGFSYLDGVQVKVSEKFRPPRKVTLPFNLSRNSLPQSLNAEYDFSTELRAIEEAERYRREQEAKRQACVDRVAADIEQFTQSKGACNGVPVQPNSILLPAPAAETKEPAGRGKAADQGFSLAEFENDTSSPFDYIELQTINDMEELNSVFQGMTAAAPPAQTEEWNASFRPTGQTAENTRPANGFPTVPDPEDAAPKPLRTSRSASDLRSSGDRNSLRARQCNTPPAQQMPGKLPNLVLQNEISNCAMARRNLTAEEEDLLRSVCDMGFPEDRSLRVIKLLGTDSKKVVEHLCQIQSLIDEGFEALDAEQALEENRDSYEQAQKFLQLQQQFQALGFPKERIAAALHEFQCDRDRALDSLLG